MADKERLVLTVEEAGQVLGVGRATAYILVREGKIPIIRLQRRVLVPKAALEKMLADVRPMRLA